MTHRIIFVASIFLVTIFSVVFMTSCTSFQIKSAVAKGDLFEVERLIEEGVDVNTVHYTIHVGEGPDKKMTLLMHAARDGHTEIAKLLIESGANVDAADFTDYSLRVEYQRGETALFYASGAGHTEIVRLLVDNGADVNAEVPSFPYGSYTALCVAAYRGYIDVVKILVESGADATFRDIDGKSVLDFAEYGRNPETKNEIIEYLKEAGAKY